MQLILGALACGSLPLAEQTVLDAGCGTGDYVGTLASHVRRMEGVELNEGMLEANTMDAFLAEREDRRRQIGQATFVIGRKPAA